MAPAWAVPAHIACGLWIAARRGRDEACIARGVSRAPLLRWRRRLLAGLPSRVPVLLLDLDGRYRRLGDLAAVARGHGQLGVGLDRPCRGRSLLLVVLGVLDFLCGGGRGVALLVPAATSRHDLVIIVAAARRLVRRSRTTTSAATIALTLQGDLVQWTIIRCGRTKITCTRRCSRCW